MADLPAPERRGLSRDEAAAYCGLSANSLERHGPKPSRIGKRCVWDRRVLDQWLDQLAGIARPEGTASRLREAIDGRKSAIRHQAR